MKIAKAQLKQIIKEELNELTASQRAAGMPRPTGMLSFYADRIREALSRHNVQLSDIAKGLSELAPLPEPMSSHSSRVVPYVHVDDVIGALANLLVEKYGKPGNVKK